MKRRALIAGLLAALALPRAAAAQSHPPLFGTREVRNGNIAQFTKWTGMLGRQRPEPPRYGEACRPRNGRCYVQEWRAMVNQARSQDPMRRIQTVNQWLNGIRYVEDIANYGMVDFWATPLEFLARDGDCEDFAISKYVSLRELGVIADDLRILVLNDLNLRIPHAILIVYLNGRSFVLDNQIQQVVPTDVIRHYQPIFSINEEAWWLHQR